MERGLLALTPPGQAAAALTSPRRTSGGQAGQTAAASAAAAPTSADQTSGDQATQTSGGQASVGQASAGHMAAAAAATAAVEMAAALELGAPVSRATTRLHLAEALARAGRAGEAEAELRNVVLEPVTPSDFPATLVARMSHVQGLIAAVRGDDALAARYLSESLAAWDRIVAGGDPRQAGARYVAALIDLGRPPVSSLVEPAREQARVRAALSQLQE